MSAPPENGPAWFYEELPFPIANAWKNATNVKELDNDPLVAVIEVALRFVASMQAATLLAEGHELPSRLSSSQRYGWTLGDWLYVVRDLSKALRNGRIAPGLGDELIAWPEHARGSLQRYRKLRNRSSHAGGALRDVERGALVTGLHAATISLLESLTWLRNLELVCVMNYDARPGDNFRGEVRSYRGAATDHPMYAERRWRGVLQKDRFYVVSPESRYALDLDAFLQWRLDDNRAQICLFNGIGNEGDARLTFDGLKPHNVYVDLKERHDAVDFAWLESERRPTDITRYDAPALIAGPDEQSVGVRRRATSSRSRDAGGSLSRAPRRHRHTLWPLLLALVLAGGAAAAIVAFNSHGGASREQPVLANGARTMGAEPPGKVAPAAVAPPSTAPNRPTSTVAPKPASARNAGVGSTAPPTRSAPAAVQSSAPKRGALLAPREAAAVVRSAKGRETGSAGAPVRVEAAKSPTDGAKSASSVESPAATLVGRWRVDTEVVHAENERPNAVGTRGHYTLSLHVGSDSGSLEGRLMKSGYTEPGDLAPRPGRMKGAITIVRASKERTFTGRSQLFSPNRYTVDMVVRVARHGDALVGLWRYEGQADASHGYSGALVGALGEAAELPAGERCFLDCAAGCFREGDDPRDPASEHCLLGCTPHLDQCEEPHLRGPAPG